MNRKLGERIRELRESQDRSLRELAKMLDGCSAAHLSDIELGRRLPSEPLLKQIASKLNVEFAELDALDQRPPVEELKRRAEFNPAYGVALRKMVQEDVSPEEMLKWLEQRGASEAKGKNKK